MRANVLLGSFVACLAVCGPAAAQNTHNLYKAYSDGRSSNVLYDQNYGNTISNPTRQLQNGNLASRASSNSRLSLRDLFTRVDSPSIRPDFTIASVPDPNKPEEYLKAFGFRRTNSRR
jgi:hypothetical protein